MRACPECNTPYPDDQKVCPIDGQSLLAPAPTGPVAVAMAPTVPTPRKMSRPSTPRPPHSSRSSGASVAVSIVPSIPIIVADDPADQELVGDTLGSYRVLSVLGKGGMGRVYLAEHVLLGRRVALKLLRPEYAAKRDAVARFFQEAKAVSRIRHKNIVDVTDFVELPGGKTFIVMELLEGQTLGEAMRANVIFPLREAIETAIQVCEGLEAAHREGIIHRDLKPDNVFVSAQPGEGRVKVLDFGVAKLIGESDSGWQTVQGSVVGTPAYMSPEQAAGISVDHRADIYSLGAILYEQFTGRRVFEGRSFGEFVLKHMSHDPVPPSRVEGAPVLPRTLEKAILRCLEKKPEERFQTAGELRQTLTETLGTLGTEVSKGRRPLPNRAMILIGGLAGGIAGLIAISVVLLKPKSTPHPLPAPVGLAPPPATTVAPGTAAPRRTAQVAGTPPMGNPQADGPKTLYLQARVALRIAPSGADVLDGRGVKLGTTPFQQEFPADDTVHVFLVKYPGYRTRRIHVKLSDGPHEIDEALRPLGPPRMYKTRRRAAPGTAPKTAPKKNSIGEGDTLDPFKQ